MDEAPSFSFLITQCCPAALKRDSYSNSDFLVLRKVRGLLEAIESFKLFIVIVPIH